MIVKNGLQMLWREAVVDNFNVSLQKFPAGKEEKHDGPSQDSLYLALDTNRTHSEHNSEAIPLQSTFVMVRVF
jgi:hypothetical protein